MANVAIWTAQEAAIESGKKVLHGTATDRVLRMFDAIRSYGPPRVALQRTTGVLQPMVKIIGELETSLKKYPPIKVGTPDPYMPPNE